MKERFGEEKAKLLQYKGKVPKKEDGSQDFNDAWVRAEVWEIWCRDTKKIYWYAEDCPEILDYKGDILNLEGFFPESIHGRQSDDAETAAEV